MSVPPTFFDRLSSALTPRSSVATNVPLADYTTFRVGGPADVLLTARTTEDITTAVRLARASDVPVFMLGVGANILVGDRGIRGIVIHQANTAIEFLPGNLVRAGSGARTYPDLITATVSRGLGGLHHYAGIPSSVGGALFQNLHFLSPDRTRTCFIAEVVHSATLLTQTNDIITANAEYFRFGYDYSILHDGNDIVLDATFALTPEPVEALRQIVAANIAWRAERHPDYVREPNAGSIFKKHADQGAGRLIEAAGLRGYRQGQVQISPKHANMIVNLGGATAREIRTMIEHVQQAVEHHSGIRLEPEIGLVGEF